MTQRQSGVGLIALLAGVVALGLGREALAQTQLGRQAEAQIAPESGVDGDIRDYRGYPVVRVSPRNTRDELAALALAETMWFCERRSSELDIVVSPEARAALDEAGIPYEVLISDLGEMIAAERAQYETVRAVEQGGGVLRGDTYFDTFRTFDEVNARTDTLVANNPGIVTPVNVGMSRFARPIRGFAISAPDSPENPRSSRRQVLFNGTQHAREWLSTTTVMWIGHQLLADYQASDPRVVALLNNAEVIFVPIINPDGYVYTWTNNRLWRKTRVNNGNGTFGVDPNRNWGYQWGGEGASTSPGNDTYRGPFAFSEPETAALRDFIIANPRIDAHIDFHTYSQLILSPWGYTSQLPPQPARSRFDRLNGDMARAIRSVHGMSYVSGPSYTTIYPASGTVPDWMLGVRDTLSWTIELRDTGAYGFVAPASEIHPTGQENYAAVLTLLDYVALPLRFTFPNGIPAAAEDGEATTFRVVIDSLTNQVQTGTAKLLARVGSNGPVVATDLTPLPSADEYLATLPAAECGQMIEFSLAAQTASGVVTTYPLVAGEVVTVPVVKTLFHDACETAAGWTVGAPGDTATTGLWENAVPQATTAQPGADVSESGTRCWITGANAGSSVGSFDVDGGATTLTSPAFSAIDPDGTMADEVVLSYWLWYSNDQGSSPAQDPFYVYISNNNGGSWSSLQTIPANGSTNAWVRFEFNLNAVIEPTNQMKLRFVADDAGSGSVLEAAVDEIRVAINACETTPDCAADFDGDGDVAVPDIFAYLSAWFANDAAADIDGTPGVAVPDIFAFLSLWFTGC